MKIAIVAAICVRHDAISAAAAGQAAMAAELPGVERVDLLAEWIDRPLAVEGHTVPDPWQLVRHPRVRAADVVIFHWGIFGTLFDAAVLLPEPGRQLVVMFHNMTPPSLAAADPPLQEKLEHSRIQLAHLVGRPIRWWTYSEENRRVLVTAGVARDDIDFVPFPIGPPRAVAPVRDSVTPDVLVVGRLAEAKGTLVAIGAAQELAERGVDFRLEFVGNPAFSAPGFIDSLRARIAAGGLDEIVTISEHVDDEGLWRRYERAAAVLAPSLHEGLCVPVVEAYRAGARVVSSDGGNLRFLVQPPDPVVPAGDAVALADAVQLVLGEGDDIGADARAARAAVVAAYGAPSALTALEHALWRLAHNGPAASWPTGIDGSGPAGGRPRTTS